METDPKEISPAIVVTGDVTMDWNIARIRRNGRAVSSWNADDSTSAHWQRGGAALLADLIQAVARAREPDEKKGARILQTSATAKPVLPGDGQYNHSYALWSPFAAEGEVAGPKVWRVADFMGLDRGTDAAAGAAWKSIEGDKPDAPIVVLDDAALGFRDTPTLWPSAIRWGKPWIILKMARPLTQGELWRSLLELHSERLIVVIAAEDLRLSEVQVSRGLSWERTAQDIFWELVHSPHVNGLAQCAQVVISFDTAGAFLLSRPGANAAPDAPPTARLFFDPAILEGMWRAHYPGALIGYTTCLTAAIATQFLTGPEPQDIGPGVQLGLGAMRKLHREGFGPANEGRGGPGPAFPLNEMAGYLAFTEPAKGSEFVAVDVRDPMDPAGSPEADPGLGTGSGYWTILGDRYRDSLAAVAEQIVLEGPEKALQGIPLGQFGKLLTVDRREIESFRSIRSLVHQYAADPRPSRPLNIAVFGSPGSGKSFGVSELALSLSGKGEVKKLTFNLSQFTDPEQLHDALHQVRDVGLSGMLPLIFWDEFDTTWKGELGWLAHFLAPMQDGEFQHGQITHSIGRAIFVFAGGTAETMAQFDRGAKDDEFRNAKGPDFVSRLKGFVDILGANPRGGDAKSDPYFIIRRALRLRGILKQSAPQIFGGGKIPNIDRGVLGAMLRIGKYKHDVRSMESVIAMSELRGSQRFNRSCLPAAAQLSLHVDAPEFQAMMQEIELEGELLRRLAGSAHEMFCDGLRARGITFGEKTDAEKKTHRFLIPFDDLPEEEKEQNRGNVRDIPVKLTAAGYRIVPARNHEPAATLPDDVIESMSEAEHDRWMKAKIARGFRWGEKTDPERKLHAALLRWRELSAAESAERYTPAEAAALGPGILGDDEKEKDRDLVRGIPQLLAHAGYTMSQINRPSEK